MQTSSRTLDVLRCRASAVAAVAVLAASANAQTVLSGHWEDDPLLAPPNDLSLEFFVAPAPMGGTPLENGSAIAPFDTITEAIIMAQLVHGYGTSLIQPFRISINVAPGDYVNETFPWNIPAHGLSIEPWPIGGGSSTRPRIDAPNSSTTTAVLCDWIGPEFDALGNPIPGSVIQGLEFRDGFHAINIEPGPQSGLAVPTIPVAVEVRDCLFRNMRQPLFIRNIDAFQSAHVIEHNVFGTEPEIGGPFLGGVAIREQNEGQGEASTLYRANRIQYYELGIQVQGVGGSPGLTVPRLLSNHIQISEMLVTLSDCDAWVIHNTMAFSVDFSAMPNVEGFQWTGAALEFHNNAVWCPVGPLASADDIRINGALILSAAGLLAAGVSSSSNWVEDWGMSGPLFVGGDVYPGVLAVDLHLSDLSPLIELGNTAAAMDPGVTFRTQTLPSGRDVRVDVSVDVDQDMRLFLSGVGAGPAPEVDIGGDEHLVRHDFTLLPECRIQVPVGPLQDELGNLRSLQLASVPGSARTWQVDLLLSGPPNGFYFLFLGYQYEATLPGTAIPNDAVYTNFLVGPLLGLMGLGNMTIDLVGQILATSGTFNANGIAVLAPFGLPATQVTDQELEWTFQMLTADPVSGRWAASNRVKIELNEGP